MDGPERLSPGSLWEKGLEMRPTQILDLVLVVIKIMILVIEILFVAR